MTALAYALIVVIALLCFALAAALAATWWAIRTASALLAAIDPELENSVE